MPDSTRRNAHWMQVLTVRCNLASLQTVRRLTASPAMFDAQSWDKAARWRAFHTHYYKQLCATVLPITQEPTLSTQTLSPEPGIIAIPPAKRPSLRILQPAVTYTGSPITPLQKGLPKQTESLCPECNKVILADIFAEDGKVVMEKSCAEHGTFRDIVFSDVELYLKMEEWNFGDNLGLSNPQIEGGKSCPDDCGLCGMHTSHTALANVDLTNRCNLTCPVCFANANVGGLSL